MSEPVESRIARIESHVEHINTVTTDLHVELRRANDRIDVTNTKMETGFKELNKKIDDGYKELNKRVDDGHKELRSEYRELRSEYKERNNKVDDSFQAVNKKIDDVHHSLKDKLHSMTIWALLLYLTLAGGLLTIIARAFKWI